MTVAELKNKIDTAELSGAFLFCGEEGYLRRYYRDSVKKALGVSGDFEEFNYVVFDGRDVNMAELRDAVHSFPMMADRKLVVWMNLPLDDMKEDEKEPLRQLCADVRGEYDYTTLLLMCDGEDFETGNDKRPSKGVNEWSKHLDIVRFDRSTDSALISWLHRHFKADGVSASREALAAMIARCGHSMETLHSEECKVASYVLSRGRTEATVSDVELVTVSNAENDTFALTNSLMQRDTAAAFNMLRELKAKRTDPKFVMGMIIGHYSSLLSAAVLFNDGMNARAVAAALRRSDYQMGLYERALRSMGGISKLEQLLDMCSETDAYLKTISDDSWGYIEKLIIRLCA